MIDGKPHEVFAAILCGDRATVRAFVQEMFTIDLTDDAIEYLEGQCKQQQFALGWGWTTSTVATWIKQRLLDLAMPEFDCTGEQTELLRQSRRPRNPELNVFFISLEETEAMKKRLTDKWTGKVTVARSKISDSNLPLKPINQVADRVAPVDSDVQELDPQ